jgi:hypothetical protein
MKRSLRALILLMGLAGTYVVAAVPRVPAPDGGPIPVCPPKKGWNCDKLQPHLPTNTR